MQAKLAALASQIAELVMRLEMAQAEVRKQETRAEAAERKVNQLEAKIKRERG
jgi:polyhydroxyalkanoate synthesis regulator phasin